NGGAYSQVRNINANFIFAVPESVTDKIAASSIVRGLTAHALAHRVFIVRSGVAVLIHAAAGGVGKILAQWCNHLGAYVIGTVGSDEKKQIALENGCHQVINYNAEDLIAKVVEYTKGLKVNAVYDSIGRSTFDRSLDCLMNMGIMVLYGSSSGDVDTVDCKKIASKSLFFTRPSVFHYKGNRFELILSANELFSNIAKGVIKIPDPEVLQLEKAALAHEKLQNRKLANSIVLIP
ncbi:MAG: zinc-binding dehydrogenase, partial [Alphaproteobacteria bacterium]